MARTTISLPDDLVERLEPLKARGYVNSQCNVLE